MDYLKNYTISYKGLKDGIHIFDYIVDKRFFEQFEHSEIKNGNFTIVAKLEKSPTFLAIDFVINGRINTQCDRCLESLDLPIQATDKIVIKFGDEVFDSRYIGEEIIVVTHQQSEINIAQYIYEFIHLNIPYKRVHPDNENGSPTCKGEALDKLDDYLAHEQEQSDPRWDKLKDLLKN